MKYPFLDLGKVNEPYFDQLEQAAIKVIRSGRYIGGDEVTRLEQMLCRMHDVPYAIAVSNGLDALRLTLRAYVVTGILAPGDEVIVPANTYIASILAISDAGLTPVTVDVDPATMNIDSSLIEESISGKTRAIMPVHLYGRVAWDSTMVDIIRRHDLIAVEDCAQAIGARSLTDGLFNSRHAGALGHAGCLSFYPTKNVGALGDAGAVLTHNPTIADTIRALANYGSDRRYHNIYKGFNCRLDPIQAAFLTVKLPHTDEENALRFARALVYDREINHPLIIKPHISPEVIDNVWHQYVIRVTEGHRDTLRQHLAQAGVGTDIHYATPPHLQPCYLSDNLAEAPVTDMLANQILSLPIATGTSNADAAEIAAIINSINL